MAVRQGHIKRTSNHYTGFTYAVPKLDIDFATLSVQRALPAVEHFSGTRWVRTAVGDYAQSTGRIPVLTRKHRIPEMPSPFGELAARTL